MPSILVAGDTHGDIDHIRYLADVAVEHQVDAVVQVGDFGFLFEQGFVLACRDLTDDAVCPMFWIDGNHDNHETIARLAGDATEPVALWDVAPDVLYVPRGAVFDVGAGNRCMGVGGAVSIDQGHRVRYVSWWPEETITTADVNRACDNGPVDVLFTHDAPYGMAAIEPHMGGCGERLDRESEHNRRAVSAIIDATTPNLVFHGHHHHRYAGLHRGRNGRLTQVHGLAMNGTGPASWELLHL